MSLFKDAETFSGAPTLFFLKMKSSRELHLSFFKNLKLSRGPKLFFSYKEVKLSRESQLSFFLKKVNSSGGPTDN